MVWSANPDRWLGLEFAGEVVGYPGKDLGLLEGAVGVLLVARRKVLGIPASRNVPAPQ